MKSWRLILRVTALRFALGCACAHLQAADLDLIINKHLINNHTISFDLRNQSGSGLNFWMPGGSHGDHLSVITITRKNGTSYDIQEGILLYTQDGLLYHQVKNDQSLHHVIDLHDGNWFIAKIISPNPVTSPKPAFLTATRLASFTQDPLMASFSIKKGDVIDMSYKVDPTPESIKYGLWTGSVKGTVNVE